ncbi:uncharacterized protein TNCV_1103841 [Trichonephila clavipes]|nr:uncharacterized protein TNCV_1103841 [Trichonephila clavipes]
MIEVFITGSPHTNTIVISPEIESGFVVKDNLDPFHCSPASSSVEPFIPNVGNDGWTSKASHVMGTAISNVLQPGTFVWFEKTQGLLMKVLPMDSDERMAVDEAFGCTRAFLTMW